MLVVESLTQLKLQKNSFVMINTQFSDNQIMDRGILTRNGSLHCMFAQDGSLHCMFVQDGSLHCMFAQDGSLHCMFAQEMEDAMWKLHIRIFWSSQNQNVVRACNIMQPIYAMVLVWLAENICYL